MRSICEFPTTVSADEVGTVVLGVASFREVSPTSGATKHRAVVFEVASLVKTLLQWLQRNLVQSSRVASFREDFGIQLASRSGAIVLGVAPFRESAATVPAIDCVAVV